MNRANWSTRVIVTSLLVSIAGACGAPGEGGGAGAGDVAVDSLPLNAELTPVESFDEDPMPLLPGEGEPREFNLLLVNRLNADAFVYASAGAARVALDTVPRSDSVFVDIRLRSEQVLLEAEDRDGTVVAAIEIDLVRTQLNRWVMTAPRRDRTASGPTRDPLVTRTDEDYPRSRNERVPNRRSSSTGL